MPHIEGHEVTEPPAPIGKVTITITPELDEAALDAICETITQRVTAAVKAGATAGTS